MRICLHYLCNRRIAFCLRFHNFFVQRERLFVGNDCILLKGRHVTAHLHSDFSNNLITKVDVKLKTNDGKFQYKRDNEAIREMENLYPNIMKIKCKKYSSIYCVDKRLAEFIRDSVCSLRTNTDSNNSPIFEANPGLGLLTEALLQNEIKNLCVFEKSPFFLAHLQDLKKQYPGRLDIVERDLLTLPQFASGQIYYSDSIENEVFSKLKVHHWNEGPAVTIIAVLSPLSDWTFTRFFLLKIPTMQSIFHYGRPECFFTISEAEYRRIVATEKDSLIEYRSSSVLYKLFFNINFIEKVPKKCFLPNVKVQKRKYLTNEDYYYFVHMVPKADLFDSVVPRKYLPDLNFFVKQCLISRRGLVFPTIEKWLPGSTPALIKRDLGIGIFTSFGELPPSLILKLFQHILILPEYEDSILRTAICDADHTHEM